MYPIPVWRQRAVLTLSALALTAGLAFAAAPAPAAVFTRFDVNATVDVRLLSAPPANVTATGQASIFGSFANAVGDLSSASSDPMVAPLVETVLGQYDGLFLSHSDVGQSGASRAAGVPMGTATADSQSDGLIRIRNDGTDAVDLTLEWAIDALAAVALTSPTGADSAGASAFAQLLIVVTDGLMNQVIANVTLNALLEGQLQDAVLRTEQFVVSVPAGAFRDVLITLETGGTSHVVPVPATLALLALGLLGLRVQREGWLGA